MDYSGDRSASESAVNLQSASARFSEEWLASAEQLLQKGTAYKKEREKAQADAREQSLVDDRTIATGDRFSRDYGNGIVSSRVLSTGEFHLTFPQGYRLAEDKSGMTTVKDRSGNVIARQSASGTLQVFTSSGTYNERVIKAPDGSQGVLVTLDTSRKAGTSELVQSHTNQAGQGAEKESPAKSKMNVPSIIYVPDGQPAPAGYTDRLRGINGFLRGR